MSTSPSFSNTSSAALAQRAVPPYAGPRYAPAEALSTGKVGPFVPAESRVAAWGARDAAVGAAAVTPVAAVVATPAVAAIAVAQPAVEQPAEMTIPSSIPPYRPLRPTPIVTPAIRTPLYIPPIPTPAGEPVVEDEGQIEPQFVHTSEFAVPAAPISEASVFDAPADEPVVSDASMMDDASETSSANDAELPWIDSFLANTPSMAMDAVVEPTESVASADDAPAVEAAADEWPLDAAAAEFRALRSAMDEVAAHEQAAPDDAGAGDEGLADLSAIAPLPVWSDDDLMDIMPIRHSGKTPLSSAAIPADGELWAERARKAHEEAQVFRAMASAQAETEAAAEPASVGDANELTTRGATAEEAAHALELLARRVRAGELTLPSYDPRMGEPAALVAALAALLGVRLR